MPQVASGCAPFYHHLLKLATRWELIGDSVTVRPARLGGDIRRQPEARAYLPISDPAYGLLTV
jgi:hypothetical protein